MKRSSSYLSLAFLIIAVLFLFTFFYYPLSVLIQHASWKGVSNFVQDPYYAKVIQFTYLQAAYSTLLCALVGVPGAFLYSEAGGRYRRFLSALGLFPFALPPILLALGVLSVWGRRGLVAPFFGENYPGVYGWAGILIAHVTYNFPIFIRLLGGAFAEHGCLEEKAALSLGLSRWHCFWEITFRKSWRSFLSACLLVFVLCSSSFLIVLLLGGGPKFTSIEVAIYQAIRQDFDLSTAVTLGIVQASVLFSALLLLGNHSDSGREGGAFRYLELRSWPRYCAFISYNVLLAFFVLLPFGYLFTRGVGALTRDWQSLLAPLVVSLKLALGCAILATSVGLCGAYGMRQGVRGWLGKVAGSYFTLPLALSSILVLLAWRLSYPGWLFSPLLCVVIAQSVFALALVIRPLKEGFSRVSPEIEKVASSLGAGKWAQFCWVLAPLLRGQIFLALALGASFSLGEAGSVLLFPDSATKNLTATLYDAMSRYRFEEAFGLGSVLLSLVVLLSFLTSSIEAKGTQWKA
jgi:thiamine transport system permease protein